MRYGHLLMWIGLALAMFYTLFFVTTNLLAGLTPDQIIGFFLATIFVIVITFFGGFRTGVVWEKSQHPRIPVIKTVPNTNLPDEIMTKKTRTIPAYIENGIAKPIGIDDVLKIGSEFIETKWLYRLCDCPTPSRAEWKGNREKYTQATKIALIAGALKQNSNGQGYTWIVKPSRFRYYIDQKMNEDSANTPLSPS